MTRKREYHKPWLKLTLTALKDLDYIKGKKVGLNIYVKNGSLTSEPENNINFNIESNLKKNFLFTEIRYSNSDASEKAD